MEVAAILGDVTGMPPSNAMLDILSLLLTAWEEGGIDNRLHGWQIMKSLRRSGPVVYSALDRLEDAHWITSEWEVLPPGEHRARRRYYHLTAAGVEAAKRQLTVVAWPKRRWPQPGFGHRVVAQSPQSGA